MIEMTLESVRINLATQQRVAMRQKLSKRKLSDYVARMRY